MDIRGTMMLSVLILLVTLSEARPGCRGGSGSWAIAIPTSISFIRRTGARPATGWRSSPRPAGSISALQHLRPGRTRNQGYAFNWARSDATTDDLIATGQQPGWPPEARGEVKLVIIFVGGNDFINALKSPEPTATLAEVLPRALANYRLAVQTILDADPGSNSSWRRSPTSATCRSSTGRFGPAVSPRGGRRFQRRDPQIQCADQGPRGGGPQDRRPRPRRDNPAGQTRALAAPSAWMGSDSIGHTRATASTPSSWRTAGIPGPSGRACWPSSSSTRSTPGSTPASPRSAGARSSHTPGRSPPLRLGDSTGG